jgi:hypothetical protein
LSEEQEIKPGTFQQSKLPFEYPLGGGIEDTGQKIGFGIWFFLPLCRDTVCQYPVELYNCCENNCLHFDYLTVYTKPDVEKMANLVLCFIALV